MTTEPTTTTPPTIEPAALRDLAGELPALPEWYRRTAPAQAHALAAYAEYLAEHPDLPAPPGVDLDFEDDGPVGLEIHVTGHTDGHALVNLAAWATAAGAPITLQRERQRVYLRTVIELDGRHTLRAWTVVGDGKGVLAPGALAALRRRAPIGGGAR